jgi:Ser/Thr protein kinase RdoA (MazF antagonist)
MPRSILPAYGIPEEMIKVVPYGTGLINQTWKIELPGRSFILQKINEAVLSKPGLVSKNLRLIGDHLASRHPDYLFVKPLETLDGNDLYKDDSGYYRLFPFIPNSHTVDVVNNADQAEQAAIQFGMFTSKLSGFDHNLLQVTIPHFHDLSLRYEQYQRAILNGNRRRVLEAESFIKKIARHTGIVSTYKQLIADKDFKLRVTHHDTKISNVLFDEKERGLCVIDMDTVMPGYFISDVGDMMRTYLSPVSEEEQDLDRISIRDEIYESILRGYHREMKNELTESEVRHYFFAGSFMIFMQVIRFLADHFNDDKYYGTTYPGHNLHRAKNQYRLLELYLQKESSLVERVQLA